MSQNNVQLQNGNGPLAGFRNQLINGDQRISQRGTGATGQSVQSYATDRWYIHADGAGTFDWSQLSTVNNAFRDAGFSHRLAITNASTQYQLRQAVELPVQGQPGQFAPGSTWTVSLYANNATDFQVWFADGATFTSGGSTQIQTWTTMTSLGGSRYSGTFTIPDPLTLTGSEICLVVSFKRLDDNTGNIQVSGCQLEPGPVATPVEIRPIQTELALCQRYYQKVGQIDAYARINNGTDLGRRWYSARTVTMRAAPTEVVVPANAALWGSGPGASGDTERWVLSGTARGSNDSTAVTSITADAEL